MKPAAIIRALRGALPGCTWSNRAEGAVCLNVAAYQRADGWPGRRCVKCVPKLPNGKVKPSWKYLPHGAAVKASYRLAPESEK